jgi:FkbM family methyltransferase
MKDILNQEYEKALLLLRSEKKMDGFHDLVELNTICLHANNTIDLIYSSLSETFITPNLVQMEDTYAKNCKCLRAYENILNKEFKKLEDMEHSIFPIDEKNACFYNKNTKEIIEFSFNNKVPINESISFYHNVYNQFELQQYYEKTNGQLYLQYDDFDVFCCLLHLIDFTQWIKEKNKTIFLFGDQKNFRNNSEPYAYVLPKNLKPRIVVLGYGERYKTFEEQIKNYYNVIAFTDFDGNTSADMYSLSELQAGKLEFDYLMVPAELSDEKLASLIKDYKISTAKILIDEYDADPSVIKTFSQSNEDIVVIWAMQKLGINIKNIQYLELGTNHPVKLNNTYLLSKYGAHGVLVEPNRNLENIIKVMRKNDKLYVNAISTETGTAKFFQTNSNELGTIAYDKLDSNYAASFHEFDVKESYMVNLITVNSILENMEKTPEVFSIDIEGLDLAVLKTMDFEKYHPLMIIAELVAWGSKHQEGDEIVEFLTTKGYHCLYKNNTNGVFVSREYADAIGPLPNQITINR